MKALPKSVRAYRRTPVFNQDTVPAALLNEHRTKNGVWVVINVISGRLQYSVPASSEEVILTSGATAVIEPAVGHRVKPLGNASFFVEFWR